LLGVCNAKLGRKDFFQMIGNEIPHSDNNDNYARITNFSTLKNLAVNSTMFLLRNILKYKGMSPYGKTHNQSDHILIDWRWHSGVFDVWFFRGADCDTHHHLMVVKVRERLAVTK
jgi:hypothetical protein